MIYTEKIKIGLKDIEKENFLANKAILEYLENIAGHHSDIAGYGINTVKFTNLAWVLLEWRIKVINRIEYGQEVTINTWSRKIDKCYGLRDFEIYDENKNLCVIASSKWLLINIEKGNIAKADEDMKIKYASEADKNVFETENFEKIELPQKYENEIIYTVTRRDIDFMGHMHNLYYLDLAYEVLPKEIYDVRLFNSIRISYKKEIKYGNKVRCKYSFVNNKHIIVIESEDSSTIHAIIELY